MYRRVHFMPVFLFSWTTHTHEAFNVSVWNSIYTLVAFLKLFHFMLVLVEIGRQTVLLIYSPVNYKGTFKLQIIMFFWTFF